MALQSPYRAFLLFWGPGTSEKKGRHRVPSQASVRAKIRDENDPLSLTGLRRGLFEKFAQYFSNRLQFQEVLHLGLVFLIGIFNCTGYWQRGKEQAEKTMECNGQVC